MPILLCLLLVFLAVINWQGEILGSIGFGKIPFIYLFLTFMAAISVFVWVYSLLTLKLSDLMPENFVQEIRNILIKKRYEKASKICANDQTFAARVIAKGIEVRKLGPQMMTETMRDEGRKCQNSLMERVKILNEISWVAPLLGAGGTLLFIYFSYNEMINAPYHVQAFLSILASALVPTAYGLFISLISCYFKYSIKNRVDYLLNTIINEMITMVRTVEIDYC